MAKAKKENGLREPWNHHTILGAETPPWQVMKHLSISHVTPTGDYTVNDIDDTIMLARDVENVIHCLMPAMRVRHTLSFDLEIKRLRDVDATLVRDAIHALLTDAGNTLLMEHISQSGCEAEGFKPRGQCFHCCYQIGPTAGYLIVDDREYHKLCWDRVNNS